MKCEIIDCENLVEDFYFCADVEVDGYKITVVAETDKILCREHKKEAISKAIEIMKGI